MLHAYSDYRNFASTDVDRVGLSKKGVYESKNKQGIHLAYVSAFDRQPCKLCNHLGHQALLTLSCGFSNGGYLR